jgi:hypothetical protein
MRIQPPDRLKRSADDLICKIVTGACTGGPGVSIGARRDTQDNAVCVVEFEQESMEVILQARSDDPWHRPEFDPTPKKATPTLIRMVLRAGRVESPRHNWSGRTLHVLAENCEDSGYESPFRLIAE